MDKSYEKIQAFSKVIMEEVARKKEIILNEANEYKEKILKEKELEFLYDSYKEIQKAIKKINLENNEAVSRTIIESKKTLYEKRGSLIDEIFIDVEKHISRFKKTPEYYDFISQNIKSAVEHINSKDIVISVDSDDIELAEKALKELNIKCTVKESETDILGGCIAYCSKSGVLINNSIIERVIKQKQQFLENYNLSID